MDSDDILRLCAEVRHFSEKADWRWQALPVIQWNFATIKDFMRARIAIEKAIGPHLTHDREGWRRVADPETLELDCHGVTFRLICRQRLATRARPTGAGAAEMIYTKAEDYYDRLDKEHERLKRIRREPKT